MSDSHLEAELLRQMRLIGLPEPEAEHKFWAKRRWPFDFAWPKLMLAVEVEGGVYSKGRHVRGQGYENDCEKYSVAAALGWTVLRFTETSIKLGRALHLLEYVMKERIGDTNGSEGNLRIFERPLFSGGGKVENTRKPKKIRKRASPRPTFRKKRRG